MNKRQKKKQLGKSFEFSYADAKFFKRWLHLKNVKPYLYRIWLNKNEDWFFEKE